MHAANSGNSKGRILIIDDTPTNLRLLMSLLTKQGYIVHPATEGELALEFVQTTEPDLILLDILMPGMNGYEVCEKLKAQERTRDIPVIFISAADHVLDKVKAFASGGVDYIVKPFHTEEVLARVATHVSLRKLQKHLEAHVAERTNELMEANRCLNAEIAERKQAEEHVRYLANHDALTGLPNRTLLEDRVHQAITKADRNKTLLAMLFLDLDDFKRINDSLGHPTGDALLKMAASRLQQCLRKEDSVARLGGDEFVLILPDLSDTYDAALVAQKVLEALSQPFMLNAHELHVNCSIGISFYPNDGSNPEALLQAADIAMYHAKEKNGGNYQYFTPQLNTAVQQRISLENQLREALARNEFVLHYQPLVELNNGRIFSAEALLRWQPPGKSAISCGKFIKVAEETGLILSIGEWALHQACRQLKVWQDLSFPDFRVAVNLSARQFYQPRFQESVMRILSDTQVCPQNLDLELTESMLVQPSEENLEILKQLSDLGIRFAVDDFGMGYSNLAYLQRFPIHTLKIDRSFISQIGQDPQDTALVTAIIAMAKSLRLRTVAEGIETSRQVHFLRAHGCSAGQGFYYSKPVCAQTFTKLLHQQTTEPMEI